MNVFAVSMYVCPISVEPLLCSLAYVNVCSPRLTRRLATRPPCKIRSSIEGKELKLEDQEGHQDDITAYIKSNFYFFLFINFFLLSFTSLKAYIIWNNVVTTFIGTWTNNRHIEDKFY